MRRCLLDMETGNISAFSTRSCSHLSSLNQGVLIGRGPVFVYIFRPTSTFNTAQYVLSLSPIFWSPTGPQCCSNRRGPSTSIMEIISVVGQHGPLQPSFQAYQNEALAQKESTRFHAQYFEPQSRVSRLLSQHNLTCATQIRSVGHRPSRVLRLETPREGSPQAVTA